MKIKKLSAVVLAALLTLSMGTSVFAQTVPATVGSGNAQITIDKASVGEEYKVYKVFDATVGAGGEIAYTTDKDLTGTSFTKDAMGNVSTSVEELTDADKTWMAENGELVASETANGDGTLTFTGLDYGYYYITSGLGVMVMVDSTDPNATIVEKNLDNPGKDGDDYKTVSSATKTIGETVTYTVKFVGTNFGKNASNEWEQIKSYTIVDTSDDIKIDLSTVKVTVNSGSVKVDTSYNDGVMTVVIPWADSEGKNIYNSGAKVVMTYDAEILAVNEADNSVDLKWNETANFGHGDAKVNNYGFKLNKTNGSKALEGAEFTLAKALSDDASSETASTLSFVLADGVYTVASTEDTETTTTLIAGSVDVKGLGAGTYYLTETKAPAGYNKLTAPITIAIDEAGNVTMNGSPVTEDVEVVNQAGSLLPSTGGVGTTMFYVIGGILVVGAGVVLVSKKRMANK